MNNQKPSPKLRILLIFFLVWNFIGIIAFITDMLMDPSTTLNATDLEFSKRLPLWTKIAYCLAVTTGTAGVVGLLIRKRWAKITLGVSLLSVVSQMYHMLFVAGAIEVYGMVSVIMPIIVVIISIVLFRIAQIYSRKNWYI